MKMIFAFVLIAAGALANTELVIDSKKIEPSQWSQAIQQSILSPQAEMCFNGTQENFADDLQSQFDADGVDTKVKYINPEYGEPLVTFLLDHPADEDEVLWVDISPCAP